MPLGLSYAPGADIPFNGSNGQQGGAPSRLSPQQAVRILSLRVPERLPSNAPVARQLLTSPGGSAAGAPSSLQAMLQQLMRPQQTGGSPMVGPQHSAGAPMPPSRGANVPAPPDLPAGSDYQLNGPFPNPQPPPPQNFSGYPPPPMYDGGGGDGFTPRINIDEWLPQFGLDFNPGLMNPRAGEWIRQQDGWAGPAGG